MKFTSPKDCGLGVMTPSQKATFNFVEGKIQSLEFEFEVPYPHQKNADVVSVIAADSGWKLTVEKGERTKWKLTPAI